MSDAYVKIDCLIVKVTPKAVLIDVNGSEHWVPRSCIHGGDEIRLDALHVDDEVELKIFQWIAEREGFY